MISKKGGIYAGGVVALFLCLTGFIAFATTSPIRQVGPWYTAGTAFDSTSAGQVGGQTRTYLAADTLRVGQVVYLSAKNTAAKSATLANYNTVLGIVCGGIRISGGCSTAVADTFALAATANQKVYVCDDCRVWALVDTAAGTSPGTQLIPSARSNMGGRLGPRTTAIDSQSRIVGRAVDTVVSGKAVLVNVRIK